MWLSFGYLWKCATARHTGGTPLLVSKGRGMVMTIEVRLLGPLEVRGPAGPVHFSGARRRAVFAMLALRTGRMVSRSALVDGLWGEDVPPTGTKTLQGHVAKVRRSLELAGADGVVLTREP